MKSLILKDFYNISRNTRSMFVILLVFAVVFLPSSGIQNYIFICAILCSMMIITTFSFDEHSSWPLYAMIMPVSKKDIVAGKYAVLFAFSLIGIIFGIIAGTAGNIVAGNFFQMAEDTAAIPLPLMALTALSCSTVFGSISIPLAIQFGAEKGRILVLVSFLIPAGLCYAAYHAFLFLGLDLTENLKTALFYCSPIPAAAWNYMMYKISCFIFTKKDMQ